MLLATVRGCRRTSFAGVPYTFDLLDQSGFAERDLPRLRYVTQAGGRLAPERVRSLAALGERRGWDFFVMYGQTEATARMAYLPPELASAYPHTIGAAIPGGRLSIEPVPRPTDDTGVGELVYEGPNVMLGYSDSPADLALGRTVDGCAPVTLHDGLPTGWSRSSAAEVEPLRCSGCGSTSTTSSAGSPTT